MTVSCGIDFGTTNTAAAVIKNDITPQLVELEDNNITIPSALFFSEDNKVYFGRRAMKMYTDAESGRCMRSLKRVLGSDLMSVGTYINNKKYSFIEILSCFLRNIKNKTDASAGTEVENVVMGRPVHFRDNDSQGDLRAQEELRKIAANVGFKNIEFQYEPIAAAFAHERFVQNEKLACVIDVGGGTSDFTILKVGKNLMKKADRKDDILANAGVRVGGNDFDKDLSLSCFMPAFGYKTKHNKKDIELPAAPYQTMAEWSKINSMYNYQELNFAKKMLYDAVEKEKVRRFVELIEKQLGYLLLNTVENTKIRLTEVESQNIKLDYISDAPIINATRDDFEMSMRWDIRRISRQIEECIKQAQVKSSDVELVILTGGSTEIPAIKKLVEIYFPNAELSQENKLSSVGLGLAYDSGRKFA